MSMSRRDHISQIVATLRWPPVKSWIEFKSPLLTYKAFKALAPYYHKELLVLYYPNRALCSQTAALLVVSEWDSEPSDISVSSCGTSHRFIIGTQTTP